MSAMLAHQTQMQQQQQLQYERDRQQRDQQDHQYRLERDRREREMAQQQHNMQMQLLQQRQDMEERARAAEAAQRAADREQVQSLITHQNRFTQGVLDSMGQENARRELTVLSYASHTQQQSANTFHVHSQHVAHSNAYVCLCLLHTHTPQYIMLITYILSCVIRSNIYNIIFPFHFHLYKCCIYIIHNIMYYVYH